jgi:FMN phosphatase YigB (HAD superfamily)
MSTVSISAVVFDLDETICEFRRTSGEVLNLAFERIGINLLFPVGEYHAIAERYMDDAEEKSERRALCFADLAEERDFDRSVGRDVAKTYNTIRDYGNVQFLPGVEATLDQLSGSYQLGLVTNGKPAMQDPKLAALDVTP